MAPLDERVLVSWSSLSVRPSVCQPFCPLNLSLLNPKGYCVHHSHDDAIKWKPFPRYWPFPRRIPRSRVNSPHKGQWRGALMFYLLSKRLSKQSWGWWFVTPSRPLWRHWSDICCAYWPKYKHESYWPWTRHDNNCIFCGIEILGPYSSGLPVMSS